MGLHTVRLIITIILFLFAISSGFHGYWFGALFWALTALAVGYPFIQKGRLNLYYDDPPVYVMMAPS